MKPITSIKELQEIINEEVKNLEVISRCDIESINTADTTSKCNTVAGSEEYFSDKEKETISIENSFFNNLNENLFSTFDLIEGILVPKSIFNKEECQKEFQTKTNSINKEIENLNSKAQEISKKLDKLFLELSANIMFLNFYVYYFVHYNKTTTIKSRYIEQSNYLIGQNINLGIDKLSKINSGFTSISDNNSSLSPILNSLEKLNINQQVSNDSKNIISLVNSELSKLSNIPLIVSQSEFSQHNFNYINNTIQQYESSLEQKNEDYLNNLKKLVNDYVGSYPEDKRNGINEAIFNITIPGLSYSELSAIQDSYSNFNSGANSINKNYTSSVNSLKSNLINSLRNQFPVIIKTLSDDINMIGGGKYDFTINSSLSFSGIIKNLIEKLQSNELPQANNEQNFIKDRNLDIVSYFSEFFKKYEINNLNMKYLALKLSSIENAVTINEDYFKNIDKFISKINDVSNQIIIYFDYTNEEAISSIFEEKYSNLIVCDEKIYVEENTKSIQEDLNNRGFSENEELSDISKIAYWKKFAEYLNVVSLIPKNYPIGLLTPSPSGVSRIPLPIIWKPLVVMKTPTSILVNWITINGTIVFTTVFELKLLPKDNYSSYHKLLFRGSNILIKSKTGVESSNSVIINNIDTNPEFSKTLPLTKDDLPIPERMSLKNPLFVKFLDQWVSKCKPYMGYP